MFAKVSGGAVVKYPYTVEDLRQENPNTSYPANVNLLQFGAVHVVATDKPVDDETKIISEGTPIFQNNRWEQVWVVTDAPAGTVQARRAALRQRMQLSFVQMVVGLVTAGWITEAEGDAWLAGTLPPAVISLINTLPADRRFLARARASRPSTVLRNDTLVNALAQAQGKTPTEVDNLFITYSQV